VLLSAIALMPMPRWRSCRTILRYNSNRKP